MSEDLVSRVYVCECKDLVSHVMCLRGPGKSCDVCIYEDLVSHVMFVYARTW